MSLLDFAVAFGAGAADSLAESTAARHRSKLEEQRQANLARLKAQYATEEKFETAGRIADLATSADPRDQAKAMMLGYKPPQPAKGTPQHENVTAILRAQGIPEGTPEYQERYAQLMQDLIMRPTTSVTIRDTEEGAFAKELGALEAREFVDIQQASATATRQRAEIDRLEAGLSAGRFTTGVFAEPRVFLAQLATLAGFDSEALGLGDAATADQMESAMKLIAANLFKEVASGTGTPRSNAMLQFIQDAGPKLSRTPEGNAVILEVLRRKSVRDNEIAQLADYYRRTYRSLSPEDENVPSFYMAAQALEENDPLVSDELRERIVSARDSAPSASEAFGRDRAQRAEQLEARGKYITATTEEGIREQLESAGIKEGDLFLDLRRGSPSFGRIIQRGSN